MNLKTVAGWAVVAFIVFWVIQEPTHAAQLVHNVGTFFSTAAAGLSHFVSQI